jgi:excisionase family DNA binding protein
MSFLSIKRAALTAGCSHRHLLRLIQHKRIRTITVNRKRFIMARELDAWMQRSGRTRSR